MATRLGAPLCLETDNDADTERGEEESDSPLLLWCSEAEALDLATPESFRHHLALIGEIAEAEHEVRGDALYGSYDYVGGVFVSQVFVEVFGQSIYRLAVYYHAVSIFGGGFLRYIIDSTGMY